MSLIMHITLGVVFGYYVLGLLSQFSDWRSRRRVEKRIRQLNAQPCVPLYRQIVAALKYELDLLRHYKYARHQSRSRRLF